jgi:hypothetical protein
VEAIAPRATCDDLPIILMVIFHGYYISIMVVSHKKWWCKHQKRLDIWLVNESMAGRNSSCPWFHHALT